MIYSRLYNDAQVISRDGKVPVASQRIYMQDRPEISACKVVGLGGFFAGFGLSSDTSLPEPGVNVAVDKFLLVGLGQFLFITLCDNRGEIVFNSIPAASLILSDNTSDDFYRIKRYTAVNLDI